MIISTYKEFRHPCLLHRCRNSLCYGAVALSPLATPKITAIVFFSFKFMPWLLNIRIATTLPRSVWICL